MKNTVFNSVTTSIALWTRTEEVWLGGGFGHFLLTPPPRTSCTQNKCVTEASADFVVRSRNNSVSLFVGVVGDTSSRIKTLRNILRNEVTEK